jgi:hypothetical protein
MVKKHTTALVWFNTYFTDVSLAGFARQAMP